MPERPSAPGPLPPGSAPGPTPPGAPSLPPDEADDGSWADGEDDDGEDAFGRTWPDDEDDDALPEAPPLDDADPLDPAEPGPPLDDEEPEAAPAEETDLDELEDLAAADDTDIPVIDADLQVRLDGRTLPARVEWARSATVWVRPAGADASRRVTLEVAGRRIAVEVAVVAGDQECVLLGRDVLRGRFLLRF